MVAGMKISPSRIMILALVCVVLLPGPARASSAAETVGAFAGAMRYCDERVPGSDSRYRRARLSAAREIDGMRRHEQRRARAARDRAYQRGVFRGESLDRRSCARLVRASEWHRYSVN